MLWSRGVSGLEQMQRVLFVGRSSVFFFAFGGMIASGEDVRVPDRQGDGIIPPPPCRGSSERVPLEFGPATTLESASIEILCDDMMVQ